MLLLSPARWMLTALSISLLALGAERSQASETPNPANPPTLTLTDLIRQGLQHNATGNLAAAEETWRRLRRDYPSHPAAPLFELKTLQARRSLDFMDGRHAARMRELAEEARDLAQDWVKRAGDDAQAHFYLGQPLFELMILDGMDARYYRAGTNGERSRKHLERALELDPQLIDAKLPLGSYYYYASIASRFIGWLSWLWFIPTGEHDTGLAYVNEVRHRGDLFRVEAATTVARFYLYLEGRPDLGESILAELHERYPENTYLHFELVELHMSQRDYAQVVTEALELEHGTGEQFGDRVRRKMARIWRARAELFRGRTGEADALLHPLEAQVETLSSWSRRWLILTRGHLHDLAGEREAAISSYEQVVRLNKSDSWWSSSRTLELARKALDEPFELNGVTLPTAQP